MQRDSQRGKVYATERDVFKFAKRGEGLSINECQRYVEKVLGDAVVRRHYSSAEKLDRLRVIEGRNGGYYRPSHWDDYNRCFRPVISLGLAGRADWVMLHETAHALTYWHTDQWHGPEFVECYLFLVRQFLGIEMHDRLKASFVAHGVRTKPKSKRAPLSPERKAQLANQLAAARAVKATRNAS